LANTVLTWILKQKWFLNSMWSHIVRTHWMHHAQILRNCYEDGSLDTKRVANYVFIDYICVVFDWINYYITEKCVGIWQKYVRNYRLYLQRLNKIHGSVFHIKITKCSYQHMSVNEWYLSLTERLGSTINALIM
jgi:hypothetical protein